MQCLQCPALAFSFWNSSPLAQSRGTEGPRFSHCSLEALNGGSIPGMQVYIRISASFQTRSSSVMLCQASAVHICGQILLDESLVSSSFTHFTPFFPQQVTMPCISDGDLNLELIKSAFLRKKLALLLGQ